MHPPAIVGKPGETITVPIFVSHYSDRAFRRSCGGGSAATTAAPISVRSSSRRSIPDHLAPYDVVELEPLRFNLPEYPFVGALILTLRDPQNQRFAANFVNLVVKPDRPLPRIERRGMKDVSIRFAPKDFASQQWSESAKSPAGKVYGHGKGYFEYRVAHSSPRS